MAEQRTSDRLSRASTKRSREGGRIGRRGVLRQVLIASTLLAAEGGLPPGTTQPARQRAVGAQEVTRESRIVLVDDFAPQPLKFGRSWDYNRLGGDRGELSGWYNPTCGCGQNSVDRVQWGRGQVTARITEPRGAEAWLGAWSSLSHPADEGVHLDFSAIFPDRVLPRYQGRVTGARVSIADGRGTFVLELESPGRAPAERRKLFSHSVELRGGPQVIDIPVPPQGAVRTLSWLVKGKPPSFVAVDRLELIVEVPALPPTRRAFLWSYAMLLANWDPASGLTRDRANFPAGAFDNVSASGVQAAAAVLASRLGFISAESAVEITRKTAAALADLVPKRRGLLPHHVKAVAVGDRTEWRISESSEWSTVDTVVALLALMEAQHALGLDGTATEALLRAIDWKALILPDGSISHGFDVGGRRLDSAWRDFGGETWLTNFAYALDAGLVAPMKQCPTTFNGSGFVDELAWLFVEPPATDAYGVDWASYRGQAAERQISYYRSERDTGTEAGCYARAGLFGLSAAEIPDPSRAADPRNTGSDPTRQIYQPFGVGGATPANDGSTLEGQKASVAPHYIGVVAAVRPTEAQAAWGALEEMNGPLTPLNNVESLFFDAGGRDRVVWNALKGSWNLGLQTLGWGARLAIEESQPNPLQSASTEHPTLRGARALMVQPVAAGRPVPTPGKLLRTHAPVLNRSMGCP
jgi:hypothetical protein